MKELLLSLPTFNITKIRIRMWVLLTLLCGCVSEHTLSSVVRIVLESRRSERGAAEGRAPRGPGCLSRTVSDGVGRATTEPYLRGTPVGVEAMTAQTDIWRWRRHSIAQVQTTTVKVDFIGKDHEKGFGRLKGRSLVGEEGRNEYLKESLSLTTYMV